MMTGYAFAYVPNDHRVVAIDTRLLYKLQRCGGKKQNRIFIKEQ